MYRTRNDYQPTFFEGKGVEYLLDFLERQYDDQDSPTLRDSIDMDSDDYEFDMYQYDAYSDSDD